MVNHHQTNIFENIFGTCGKEQGSFLAAHRCASKHLTLKSQVLNIFLGSFRLDFSRKTPQKKRRMKGNPKLWRFQFSEGFANFEG